MPTRKSLPWTGWKNEKPSTRERTQMLSQCGRPCFLGPRKSFPICTRNTCTINKKGLWAAYVRARARASKKVVYRRIAQKSRKMLQQRGYKMK